MPGMVLHKAYNLAKIPITRDKITDLDRIIVLKRVLNWIGYVFLTMLILTITTVLFLLISPKTLPWVADKIAVEYGFTYKHLSGSVLTGVRIEALRHKNELILDTLDVGWDPLPLLNNEIYLTHLNVEGLDVDQTESVIDDFYDPEPDDSNSSFSFPFTLSVDKVALQVKPFVWSGIGFKNIVLQGEDLIYYGNGLDADALTLSLESNVTNISMNVSMQEKDVKVSTLKITDIDTIAWDSVIRTMITGNLHKAIAQEVEPEVEKQRAGLKNYLPRSVQVDKAILRVKPCDYPQVRLEKADMNISSVTVNIYKIIDGQPNAVEVSNFSLALDSNLSKIVQQGNIRDKHLYTTGRLSPSLTLFQTLGLPFREGALKDIVFDLNADEEQIVANVKLEADDLLSGEERKFNIEQVDLNNRLVYNISSAQLGIETEGNISTTHAKGIHIKNRVTVKNAEVNATAKVTSDLVNIDVKLTYDKVLKVLTSTRLPKNSLLRELVPDVKLDAFSPLQSNFTLTKNILDVNMSSKNMNSDFTLDIDSTHLKGDLVLGDTKFTGEGNISKVFTLKSSVNSLQKLFTKVKQFYAFSPPPLDGDVKISLTLDQMKKFGLDLDSKQLIYKQDAKHNTILHNTMLSLGYENDSITLRKYHTTFEKQKIFATKPSQIIFKEEHVEVSPLWVNDELKLTGKYNLKEKKGEILAYADPLHISHEVTSLASRVHIKSTVKGNAASINGNITLLGGAIHYDMDTKTFDADSDIVMIEELKKKEQNPLMDNLQINVNVNTSKTLYYQTKDANIGLSADLWIKKEPKGALNIQGTVDILEGSTYIAHGKKFVLRKSRIIFKGDPKKPVVDMAVTYKTQRSEILIQITGSPASPHLVFSSVPYMSRQEILSMILFDSQEGVEDSSEEDMVKMMGDSMKNSVFNNAGGAVTKSLLSKFGIKPENIPFVGGSKDANKRKHTLTSYFSNEEIEGKPRHHIRFYGQRYFDEKALQEAMGVETKAFYQFWKKEDPKIKDTLLGTLEASLRNFYTAEGFYNVKLSIKQTPNNVIVNIRENKPVKIHAIDIQSDHDISDLVSFEKGRVFKTKEFVAVKINIMNRLLKEGYCNYNYDTKAYVDRKRKTVNIVIKLNKGEVCTFGKITVRKVKTIDNDIILSRMRAKEGERFSTDKIESSYEALYGLEAFDSVVLNYDVQKNNIVTVEVSGQEITKPWYLKAGASWESATGLRLSAEVIRANLFGNAQTLGFGLVYSQIEKGAEAEYNAPAKFKFLEYYLDLTAKVGYAQFEYTGFVEDKVYARVFLTYDGEHMNLHTGLAVENIELSLLEGQEASRYKDPGSYQIVYPFFDFVYDSRDSRINPKQGYYLAGSVEYASPFKNDGSSYLKYDLEGRAIVTLFKDLTLSAVGKLGTIDALENKIPASKLFYAGGLDSNRAYGYKRVGVTLSPSSFSIVGGSSMANLSLEANYPLWDNIYGAVFTDSTMLGIDRFDFGGDILNSAGIGLRYITPIGPLKVDWGANIEDSSQNAIHFQIGQSF